MVETEKQKTTKKGLGGTCSIGPDGVYLVVDYRRDDRHLPPEPTSGYHKTVDNPRCRVGQSHVSVSRNSLFPVCLDRNERPPVEKERNLGKTKFEDSKYVGSLQCGSVSLF